MATSPPGVNDTSRVKAETSESVISQRTSEARLSARRRSLEAFIPGTFSSLRCDGAERGLSVSLKHVHNVMSGCMTQAVKWPLIKSNPARLAELTGGERGRFAHALSKLPLLGAAPP